MKHYDRWGYDRWDWDGPVNLYKASVVGAVTLVLLALIVLITAIL